MFFRWVPVFTDDTQQLGVMSIAFLLKNENDAVVWRGPKKNGLYKLTFILCFYVFLSPGNCQVYCPRAISFFRMPLQCTYGELATVIS